MLSQARTKRAGDRLQERAPLVQNEPLRLCEVEIRARLPVGLEPRAVRLVGRKAVAGNEPPGDIVRSLVRQEITDEASSAAGNDRAPVPGVGGEGLALDGIDIVTNEADDGHGDPFEVGRDAMITRCVATMVRLTSNYERRTEHRRDRRASG